VIDLTLRSMSLITDVLEAAEVGQRAKDAKVRAAEARRTSRDRKYEKKIDALIPDAERLATEQMEALPRRADKARRAAWEQAWARKFHRAMDLLCAKRGLRRMSWQA
jgi:hypothetical protein